MSRKVCEKHAWATVIFDLVRHPNECPLCKAEKQLVEKWKAEQVLLQLEDIAKTLRTWLEPKIEIPEQEKGEQP